MKIIKKNNYKILNELENPDSEYFKNVREYYLPSNSNIEIRILTIEFEKTLYKNFKNFAQWSHLSSKIFINLCLVDSYYGTQLFRRQKGEKVHSNHAEMVYRIMKEKDIISSIVSKCNKYDILSDIIKDDNIKKIDELIKKISLSSQDNSKELNKDKRGELSLTTKFLHFCAPNVFPIFDNLALSAWNKLLKEEKTKKWVQNYYKKVKYNNKNKWTINVNQYSTIIYFYRCLWKEGLSQDGRNNITKECKSITKEVGFTINELTFLDKFFWKFGRVISR